MEATVGMLDWAFKEEARSAEFDIKCLKEKGISYSYAESTIEEIEECLQKMKEYLKEFEKN